MRRLRPLAFALVAVAAAAPPSAAQELLVNPGFDTNLAGWSAQLNTTFSTRDAAGSVTSGSAMSAHDQVTPGQLFQCVAAVPGVYRANVKYLVPAAQPTTGSGVFRVWAFAGSSCSGSFVDVQEIGLPSSAFDTWISASHLARVPPGAGSALFQLFFQRDQSSGVFLGHFDDASLVATDEALLLGDFGRFRVESAWETANPTTQGMGHGEMFTARSGYFWFFSADNVELVVKVLDGCAINNRHWVFIAGLTNVEVAIQVTDRSTGSVRNYANAQGHYFTTVLDTSAFPCP